ncbi:MAG TPA: protein translocase subunit SecD [Longimicrobium sp.]|nr:protein translocase subunit SecD [Longimicrobium sp.]
MFQNTKARVGLIVLLAALAGFFLWRNEATKGQPVTLGLDLQGGVHLGLEIDESRAALAPKDREEAIDRALKVVRLRVENMGLSEPVVQKAGNDRIIVELAGLKDTESAKKIIQKAAFLEFQIVRPATDLQAALPRVEQAILAAFPAEAKAAPSSTGGLFRNAPGADTTRTARPFESKLQGGTAGQFLVADTDTAAMGRYLRLPAVQAALPRGTTLLWGVQEAEETRGARSLWLVEEKALMTGEYLENAIGTTDQQFGRPVVNFTLNRRGGRVFGRETARNIQKQMAIVLDDQVYSAPTIQSRIERNGQITMGGATVEDAADLALVLRAGALPAPLKVVEERTVGASLGSDSIEKGQVAGIIGVVGVILIMLAYYRLAGLFAVGALALYVLYTMGTLAALDAVLTFPGIAGLVLSIGMSVDANVLIFERIREELDAGRTVRPAVSEGFKQALSAIVDSNLTTLITAAILFYVGTGPIQGFAVTLGAGIVISMFSAIFVTRTLFILYLERRSPAAQGLSI